MAERRMFSKKIIDTDWFMDMPASTQNLYFHLSMRADDDGFVGSPSRIIKMIGASNDDYKLLIAKKFIIPFESGVCVIKDWRLHNYIQSDRYTPTTYIEEKNMLSVDKNKGYIKECIQNVYNLDTQDSIELDKNRIDNKESKKESETFDDIINSLVDNAELKEVLVDFIKMRKTIKKPLTNRALKSIITRTKQLSNNKDEIAIKIIDQSIRNGWQDVYEIKQEYNKAKADFQTRDYTKEELNNLYDSLDDTEI